MYLSSFSGGLVINVNYYYCHNEENDVKRKETAVVVDAEDDIATPSNLGEGLHDTPRRKLAFSDSELFPKSSPKKKRNLSAEITVDLTSPDQMKMEKKDEKQEEKQQQGPQT